MTLQSIVEEVKRLTVAEQIQLYDVLAELVAAGDELTPAQSADLDRRLDEYHAGKAQMSPGDEVFARLRARYDARI